jgi:voltage-gated potassium channel
MKGATMRRRIYEILNNPRPDDRAGRLISAALLALIAANVTASILETDAELARSASGFFDWFEWISITVFSVEYLLRLWSCTAAPRFRGAVRGRLRMALTPMALIDLVAIAPSYVELLLPGTLDLRFLRVLRLLRLFRLLRSSRIAEAFATLVRVLQGKRVELAVSLAIVVVAMLLAAGAIYVAERGEPGTQFTSIPRAMWWAVETITTIGYGDMIPATPIGKVIGGLVAFTGICAVALPVGIVSSGFIEELNRKKQPPAPAPRSCPHCGSALDP